MFTHPMAFHAEELEVTYRCSPKLTIYSHRHVLKSVLQVVVRVFALCLHTNLLFSHLKCLQETVMVPSR